MQIIAKVSMCCSHAEHLRESKYTQPSQSQSNIKTIRIYLRMQQKIYLEYFQKWLKQGSDSTLHQPMMMSFRDLNMDTSLRTFLGDYIPAAGAKAISDNYWLITRALQLVNFPLAIPGTNVYAAVKARKIAVKIFEDAIKDSKKAMSSGLEPHCLVDEWNKNLLAEHGNTEKYSDHEMALVVLSFIFASQGGFTLSLLYIYTESLV